jgi:hypothetical protein
MDKGESATRARARTSHWLRAAVIPISHTEPGDIFIAGYPKSGNTWFQVLVAGIVYGRPPEETTDEEVQRLVPDVHAVRAYERRRPVCFFKTHFLPRPAYRNAVVLVRDGRDVMVSYLHHRRALEGPNVDFAAMIERGEGLFPCRWHEHVEAWLAAHGGRFLFIKYEDLLEAPVPQLERFCDFAGIERTRAQIERVAAGASFDKMRARERAMGWSDPAWPKDKPFVRRGQAGSYRTEMSPELVAVFERTAGGTLERCGYPRASKEKCA